jgi:nitroreductase
MNTSVIEAIERQKTTNLYDASKSIPDDEIRELVRLATFSPTAFHLQNWRFIAVRSPEAKARLRAVAADQPKVTLPILRRLERARRAHVPLDHYLRIPAISGRPNGRLRLQTAWETRAPSRISSTSHAGAFAHPTKLGDRETAIAFTRRQPEPLAAACSAWLRLPPQRRDANPVPFASAPRRQKPDARSETRDNA